MSKDIGKNVNDCRALILKAISDEEKFLKIIFSDNATKEKSRFIKITAHPVKIRRKRELQFEYFDSKKCITKNYQEKNIQDKIDEILNLNFRQICIQMTEKDIHIRITKKGKVLITEGKPSRNVNSPELMHNRQKQYPLTADDNIEFLHELGILSRSGKVLSSMQGKFKQVNEFLKLFEQLINFGDYKDKTLEIIDCGCGSAYLTFSVLHYFKQKQNVSSHIVGIDNNPEIIDKCVKLRDSLDWEGLEFFVSNIADYKPEKNPDVLLSLHACDTATDEAIAQGIRWKCKIIIAAPCCQHELYSQLKQPVFQPVLKHGILKHRTADILTDAFRAQILRIMGYQTDVVEFVSHEHTSKNLMIRAKKTMKPGNKKFITEYKELKKFWDVEPFIENLLKEEFEQVSKNSL